MQTAEEYAAHAEVNLAQLDTRSYQRAQVFALLALAAALNRED